MATRLTGLVSFLSCIVSVGMLTMSAGAVTVKVGEDQTFVSMDWHRAGFTNDPNNLLSWPEPREATSVSNTASVSLVATPGHAGVASAEIGLNLDWDTGTNSWDDVKDLQVRVTMDMAYELQSEWLDSNGGSANAFLWAPAYEDGLGYETGETGSRSRTVTSVFTNTLEELEGRIAVQAYCQAHLEPDAPVGARHTSRSSVTINGITLEFIERVSWPYRYTVDNGTVTITRYLGAGGAVVVPDRIAGLPVAGVGDFAFADCAGITSVVLPTSVTHIGHWAFGRCTGLTDVTVPHSVTSIADFPFGGCTRLNSINVDALNSAYCSIDGVLIDKRQEMIVECPMGKAGSYAIPGSVTSIGHGAFASCSNLISVTIPNSVTNIRDVAFVGCVGLDSLTLGSNVVGIGHEAFYNCQRLVSVTIPASVTYIGYGPFADCSNLTTIAVDSLSSEFSSLDGVLFDKNQKALVQYPGGKSRSYIIPSGVTAIRNWAFLRCNSLTNVVIPASVTNMVNGGSFASCESLIEISVAEENPVFSSVEGVLYDENQTTLVQYPGGRSGVCAIRNGVLTIGDSAFCADYNLTTVLIPKSVASIGDFAFSSCPWLIGVYFGGDAPSLGEYVFDGDYQATVYYSSGTMGWGETFGDLPAVLLPFSYTINPDDTVTITEYTGPGGDVEIPDRIAGLPVTDIGDNAFSHCYGLTGMTIPAGVRVIGELAFDLCTGLTSITVDPLNDVYSSLDGVLFDRDQTTLIHFPEGKAGSYTIPASVKSLSVRALAYCTGLTTINVDAANTAYRSLNGVLFNKSLTTLIQCPGGKTGSYAIPGTVTNIGVWAFYGCIRLTGVTIPSSVMHLGEGAFASCFSLVTISLPGSVVDIGKWAFESCVGMTSVAIGSGVTNIADFAFLDCDQLAGVTIPARVKHIGGDAFYGCDSLASVALPASVTSIGVGAFGNCGKLTTITVAAQNAVYSSLAGVLFNKGQTMIVQYPAGKAGSYSIPPAVTNIGSAAFIGCHYLTGLTIPDAVVNIGIKAFFRCDRLTSVIIPDRVRTIDITAFDGCSRLVSMLVGSGVADIGIGAFSECYALTGLYFKGNAPNLGDWVFDDSSVAIVYHLAVATGWGETFGGLPTALWDGIYRQTPVISMRSPVADPAAVNEGVSVAFNVTAGDSTDPDSARRGMSNVTWFVDGTLKQTTKTGAPNTITSAFTYKTDSATVRGSAFRDVLVKAVALDKQGETTETEWTVRVNNVSVAQTVRFGALPVKALGDPDFLVGATASSGLPVVYSNSNPAVAQVFDGLIHIVGAGMAVITASQPGNFDFKAATPVKQTLTVKARLTALTPSGGGTVTGQGLYTPGAKVVLAAKPNANNTFLRWEDGSQGASRSLIMPGSNVTVSAWFGLTTNVPPPTVAAPGSQQAMVGVPFALPLDIRSENLPTVTVSGLPAGLAYVAATKTVAGVPQVAVSNKVVTVSAKNVNRTPGTNTFTITVAALHTSAQGTFTGFALETAGGGNRVKGTVSMTMTPLGAVSAKVVAQAGVVSFTGKSWDSASGGVFRATLRTTKGETLALAQDVSAPWDTAGLSGSATGGLFGAAALEVRGQRNGASAKTAADYAAATNALAHYKGYYTVALPPDAELEAPGAAVNVPLGSGWLALTVKDGGAVTLAGKLADGTVLSSASTLLIAGDGVRGEAAYVPFLFPLYAAKGGFSGILEILPEAGACPSNNIAMPAESFIQVWNYPGKVPTAVPPQTEDRFALALGASGGFYNTLADLRAHYSNACFVAQGAAVSNTYASGAYTATVGIVEMALPEASLRFDPATGAMSLPAGQVPVYSSAASNYVFAVTNPAVATLTATKATGLFAGKFNLYYEYRDQTGALKLKTVSVPHEGVLTPVRAEFGSAPLGQGFYLVPDTWKSPDAKPVAYPLKRSYGVEIRGGE